MPVNVDRFYQDILNNLSDGVYFTDRERRIFFWNRGAERLSGYARTEVIGRSCSENILVHVDKMGNQLCTSACPLSAAMADGAQHEAEVFLHHKEGYRVPIWVRASPLRDEQGVIVGAVEIFSSNVAKTQLVEQLAEMKRLALIDPLTEVPNRRHLEVHLLGRLEELRRNRRGFGILFIDIDRFKRINDAHGHAVGDRVLRMVGRTLSLNSRIFDTIGRWGGEEFVAVIVSPDAGNLHDVAERLRLLISSSALQEPESLAVTVSIGAAEADPTDSVESLVHRADEKLYKAKSTGRNRVCI